MRAAASEQRVAEVYQPAHVVVGVAHRGDDQCHDRAVAFRGSTHVAEARQQHWRRLMLNPLRRRFLERSPHQVLHRDVDKVINVICLHGGTARATKRRAVRT